VAQAKSSYNLNIGRDVRSLMREFDHLSERTMKGSARTSTNKVITKVKRAWIKEVAARTPGVSQKYLREKRVTAIKANARFPSGVVFFRSANILWWKLAGEGKKSKKLKKGGVRVGPLYDPNAFIAEMDSGHVGVFKRDPGRERLKIRELSVHIEHTVKSVGNRLAIKAISMWQSEFNKDIRKKLRRDWG